MVTKKDIESAKLIVLIRQNYTCNKCNAAIDVNNTKSYAYSSSSGLNGRYKFSDVSMLSCVCLKCSRRISAKAGNDKYKLQTILSIDSGFKKCNICKDVKSIEKFSLKKSGNLRSTCKQCRTNQYKKRMTPDKLNRLNERKRERHSQRMQDNDMSLIASKKASWIKSNNKRRESIEYKKYQHERKKKIAYQKYIGKSCDLYLLKCYVCSALVTSKSNLCKKCNTCKINKVRKPIVLRSPNVVRSFKCLNCNCEYISARVTNGNCQKCNKKNYNLRVRKISDHIERAKKRNVFYEKINSDVIYKRDGFKCKSCGCDVVKSKEYKPNQATIDHVIPISKGGSHTIDNIVTMCQSCNSIKSNRLINGAQIGIFCIINDY